MSNKQQKIADKRKKREKLAKKRVLKRRQEIRATRKEELLKARLEKKLSPKSKPILKDTKQFEEIAKAKSENIQAQIEKNLALLEALEKEYDDEVAQRSELNKTLESEGNLTLKEKMDSIYQKAHTDVVAQSSLKNEQNLNSQKII